MSDPALGHDNLDDHRPHRADLSNGDLDQHELVTRVIHALVDTGLAYIDGDSLRRLSDDTCSQHYGYSPDCDKCDAMMDAAADEVARQLGPTLV